ncbi:MAG TPA: class I SAM-dependent methyltransferase [Acidimicrobiales bacterium]|nr:class I SAM-dependent methyltransferase [Acidimicrobiales bacterium]
MTYQHPLAYLVGLEGLALLRGWAGDFDREFTLERLAEVRALLDDPVLAAHPGVDVARADPAAGYRTWASTYDDQPNGLFAIDEPAVEEIFDSLPVGEALDAACGTGRLTRHLVARGHRVLGIDSSPEMLDVARRRVTGARFQLGDLHRLPVDDGAVDLVVCGLALAHMPDLVPVMAELARVLRPSGSLVISDAHHELVFRGSVVKAVGPHGEPGLVATYRHTIGDFLRAALAAGLRVRRCEELSRPASITPDPSSRPATSAPAQPADVAWDVWPWSLLGIVPRAAAAAWEAPAIVVWHFERPV